MEINKEELVNSADTELLDSQIDQITDSFIEEHFLDNDEAEQLELLVAKSMKLGELYERKKWQEKAAPEGFVLELDKGRFVQYELIDLLTRSLNSSKVLKTNTNWVHVVRMLNVGSTVAHRICEKLGVDPESTKFEAQEQSHD
ncbi:hypothetical protein [Acinetobacter bereziniae]|uniref:hypothetical protein n=1 Tax=Acinetobacter bereziniae TaxID=106648 RepID=UPI00301B4324